MRARDGVLLAILATGSQAFAPPRALRAPTASRLPAAPRCPLRRPAGLAGARPQRLSMAAPAFAPPAGKIKGVLFDIDGTLFDSDPVHFAVFQELLAKEGVNGGRPIDEDFFRTKIAGRQNALICADLFPQWDTATAEKWSEDKEAAFREKAAGKLQPMTGLEEVIAIIDQLGLKKAAVTNAPRPNAEFMLNVIGRYDWFDTIVIGDECERAKPDPLPYQIAMQRLGLQADECMVVEDSPSGAQAGVASGFDQPCVLHPCPQPAPSPRSLFPIPPSILSPRAQAPVCMYATKVRHPAHARHRRVDRWHPHIAAGGDVGESGVQAVD